MKIAKYLYRFFFGEPNGKKAPFIFLMEVLCTVLFVIMTLILFCQTSARAVGYSIFWAEELARFSMVWLVFLGSCVGVYYGSHTRITAFVKLFPEKWWKAVEIFVNLLCAGVIGIIGYHGKTVYKVAMMGKSPAMGLPLGYVFGSVMICSIVMVLFFINRAVCLAQDKPLDSGRR